ncbi:MAG: TolC family outer membrane protein, partial [Campylobacterota bacterium]|nr:TolC family outer membrane protein [Campylobacterota bacterium]
MLKKILFSIPLLSTLSYSQTLHNITSEIIATNPEIKEKIYYYNSVKEEYNFVKSGNLPIVDFSIKFGREHTNSPSTRKETDEGLGLYKSESSLEVVQNLFEGFATANAIDEQKARYLSASLEILEKTNSIALNVAQIYINVLKYKEMVILAKESIETHKKILVQIKEKVDAGFSPRSDMLQVQTRYTLAKSNLLTQKNNLENELIKFHKILGRFIAKKEFVLPSSHFDVPDDIDRATELALNTHPAIKVSNFNVQARKFAYEKEKRGYYPSVDLILKAEKNNNTSAIEGETDRYYAGVQLKYNLFNGFADEATIQQNISNIQEENSLRDKIRRQIIESVRLSWSRYSSLVKKEIVLKEHVLFADQAKEAYLEEFLIAKRTLLDILNIEGEFNSAKKAQTDNYYTMLYTKYQLMDSLGILSQQLGLTSSEYEYEKDSLPLNLESDNDRIIDMKDICDKTINTMGVNRYGCQEIMEEEEDEQIEEPALLEPVKKIKRKPVVKPKPKINSIAKVKPVKKQDEKVKRSLEKEMIYF